jgi:hypothetical protein
VPGLAAGRPFVRDGSGRRQRHDGAFRRDRRSALTAAAPSIFAYYRDVMDDIVAAGDHDHDVESKARTLCWTTSGQLQRDPDTGDLVFVETKNARSRRTLQYHPQCWQLCVVTKSAKRRNVWTPTVGPTPDWSSQRASAPPFIRATTTAHSAKSSGKPASGRFVSTTYGTRRPASSSPRACPPASSWRSSVTRRSA